MAEHTEHVVTGAEAGKTLAAIVRELLGDVPWSRARDLCTTGRVLVDGQRAQDSAVRLPIGARVQIHPEGKKVKRGTLPDDAIVFVDRDVVVVRKPKGVLTVPYEDTDRDTLVDLTRAALRQRNPRGGKPYDPTLGVVQRLDKDTTGLIVFARTLAAKRELGQQFRVHSIERRYVAIVHGSLDRARYETWLVGDRGDGLRGSYGVFRAPKGPPPADAQRAVTYVRRLGTLRGATLVECQLETGRQHQIRIHLSEAGHMLVGEPVYLRDHAGPKLDAPRPMLHAAVLGFVHPRTGRAVRFTDEPPEDFATLARALGARGSLMPAGPGLAP